MGRAPARHDQGPRVHTRASARVSTPLLRSHEARHGRPEQSGHNAWDERRRITTTPGLPSSSSAGVGPRIHAFSAIEGSKTWAAGPSRPSMAMTPGANAGPSRPEAAPPKLLMRGRRPAHPRLFCDRRKQDVGGRNSPAITHGASAGASRPRATPPQLIIRGVWPTYPYVDRPACKMIGR